jgi:hypothetical protein
MCWKFSKTAKGKTLGVIWRPPCDLREAEYARTGREIFEKATLLHRAERDG